MRVENKEYLNYPLNNTSNTAIKNGDSNDFATMLEKYSRDSKSVNKKFKTETTLASLHLILLSQEESKQIKATQQKTESEIQQLEKELLEVKQIKIPTRNSPEYPMDILDEAWEINNYKNSQILKIQKEIAFLSKSAFAYSLDEKGFMGEDFNKAAGIPLDYKIHYNTLEDIYQSNILTDSVSIPAGFSQVDFMQTAKNAFESFKNFYGEDFTQSNKMLSREEINALPKGFFTDYGYKNVFALIQTEETLAQIYESDIHKLGISIPPFVSFSTENIESYVLSDFIQGDKISLDGMFNEYLKRNSNKFRVAEYSQEWLAYEAYNNKITGRNNANYTPNNYLIDFDADQRFWDLLQGKISVESHLQGLIGLGYTHNGTINWGEDKDKFSNALSHFLKVFQEILDSRSLSTQELQALNSQTAQQNAQAKQESKETKESKPYEAKTKQEKMDTFLNNLLKVS